MSSMARRMFDLVEPIGVIPYSADEPNEAMFALGFSNYWDTYFAGSAAPLGLVPAEVELRGRDLAVAQAVADGLDADAVGVHRGGGGGAAQLLPRW